jgi:hypothetical protein
LGEDERIHGDENYVPERERAAVEESVELGELAETSDEADESERALAEVAPDEPEEFELEDEYTEADPEEAERG